MQMNHLNHGDGFSGVEAYQTWDLLECPACTNTAIEFYHTEFIESTDIKPIFSLIKS